MADQSCLVIEAWHVHRTMVLGKGAARRCIAQARTGTNRAQAASASMPPVMLPGTILIVFPNGSGYLGDFPSSSGGMV